MACFKSSLFSGVARRKYRGCKLYLYKKFLKNKSSKVHPLSPSRNEAATKTSRSKMQIKKVKNQKFVRFIRNYFRRNRIGTQHPNLSNEAKDTKPENLELEIGKDLTLNIKETQSDYSYHSSFSTEEDSSTEYSTRSEGDGSSDSSTDESSDGTNSFVGSQLPLQSSSFKILVERITAKYLEENEYDSFKDIRKRPKENTNDAIDDNALKIVETDSENSVYPHNIVDSIELFEAILNTSMTEDVGRVIAPTNSTNEFVEETEDLSSKNFAVTSYSFDNSKYCVAEWLVNNDFEEVDNYLTYINNYIDEQQSTCIDSSIVSKNHLDFSGIGSDSLLTIEDLKDTSNDRCNNESCDNNDKCEDNANPTEAERYKMLYDWMLQQEQGIIQNLLFKKVKIIICQVTPRRGKHTIPMDKKADRKFYEKQRNMSLKLQEEFPWIRFPRVMCGDVDLPPNCRYKCFFPLRIDEAFWIMEEPLGWCLFKTKTKAFYALKIDPDEGDTGFFKNGKEFEEVCEKAWKESGFSSQKVLTIDWLLSLEYHELELLLYENESHSIKDSSSEEEEEERVTKIIDRNDPDDIDCIFRNSVTDDNQPRNQMCIKICH